MSSGLEAETVRKQVDIYKQLKEHLKAEMERYRREGKEDLARIISQTVAA